MIMGGRAESGMVIIRIQWQRSTQRKYIFIYNSRHVILQHYIYINNQRKQYLFCGKYN